MSVVSALPRSSWHVLAASATLAVTGLMLIDLPVDSAARADAVRHIFADVHGHRSGSQQAIGSQP